MFTTKPEVLAPAGSAEALSAALGAGADAVYFGLTDFNARIRARNFELGDLPDVLLDLRRWGVRSYIVFNTLVFTEEMGGARDALEAIAEAGPDGLIVQDLGVLSLVRQVAPGIDIHASTQMTIASPDGVRLAARLGAKRVILARELSIREIARIRSEVDTELEVFVHGALCVSYSGQCLSSEAWGGRSANRGQCAQACRLPYDLIVDGRPRNLENRAYLLSPHDLEGYRRIPELMALGISAFKIEGRMKSPEYVAASTALYRAAVDQAWEESRRAAAAAGAASTDTAGANAAPASKRSELDLLAREAQQIFSRGVGEGSLGGVNHQTLVDGTTRAHRGLQVGVVLRVDAPARGPAGGVIIETTARARGERPIPLKPGDGLLFASSPREEDEVGGRILSIDPVGDPRHLFIRFPRASTPDLERIRTGAPVYRTNDPVLQARLKEDLAHPERKRFVPLRVRAEASAGEPLRLTLSDPDGNTVEVVSTSTCEPARLHGLDAESLRAQIERTGQTRYRLASIETSIEGKLFLPVSELNRMRREAVERLEDLRGRRRDDEAGGEILDLAVPAAPTTEEPPELSPVSWAIARVGEDITGDAGGGRATSVEGEARHRDEAADPFAEACVILCRDREQVRGAVEAGARRIALDFLDLVGLKEAAAELRAAGIRVTLALPRIQKPGEERIESFFLGLEPDEILVRNLGGVERLRNLRERGDPSPFPLLVGDVSLNAVNPGSFDALLELGLARVTPGLDLNAEQLEGLVDRLSAERIEVPIYHHLPVFHTEHCVFAAFLSDGADFRSCGRPCDRHRIELRDRTGQAHPVVADVGCRNTVFGARPQSSLAVLAHLRQTGVRHFRIELMSEDASAASRLIELHRSVWMGALDRRDAEAELRAESSYGVATAALEPPRVMAGKAVGARLKPPGRGVRPGDRTHAERRVADDGAGRRRRKPGGRSGVPRPPAAEKKARAARRDFPTGTSDQERPLSGPAPRRRGESAERQDRPDRGGRRPPSRRPELGDTTPRVRERFADDERRPRPPGRPAERGDGPRRVRERFADDERRPRPPGRPAERGDGPRRGDRDDRHPPRRAPASTRPGRPASTSRSDDRGGRGRDDGSPRGAGSFTGRSGQRPPGRPVEQSFDRPTRRPPGGTSGRPTRRPPEGTSGRPTRRPPEGTSGRPTRRPPDQAADRSPRPPSDRRSDRPERRPTPAGADRSGRRPAPREPDRPPRRPPGRGTEQPSGRPPARNQERPPRRPPGRGQDRSLGGSTDRSGTRPPQRPGGGPSGRPPRRSGPRTRGR